MHKSQDIATEFIGVCRGVIADGWVSAEEVWFLGNWLNEHPQALEAWPGSEFVEPLNRFFHDGVLDPSELAETVALITRIEREWAARQPAPTEPAEAATARTGAKPSKPAPAAMARIVPELFEWKHIALPRVDWQGQVAAASGAGGHALDLHDPKCDCPDWQERRLHLPVTHPARACKHIVAVLCTQFHGKVVAVSPILELLLANAHANGTGIFPADRYGCFEMKGAKVLFAFGNPPWVNVWAPYGAIYCRYGYNSAERRWAYGEIPIGAPTILQAITSAGDRK